ncbi:MAG: Fe-S cluster protector protein [Candidatus Dadabacteria bacterium]|nr:MAG: Fe-S cluster protector protein [Candidatus Dadabacteria bacterium]
MATISCKRCGKDGEQLDQKPLGGSLGDEIRDSICASCWAEWDELQLKIINEYRLNLAIPQHYDMLVDEMRNFLNLKEGATGTQSLELEDD